ncbi:DUF5694 domain-containing protein [Litoribaculum gwangyangense]|uniref:TraB/GumN family protein n=1 Tax=Litoribaculum gwangyangense TaxID=1130722 RepID=A0ABP9C9U6_9FLAO
MKTYFLFSVAFLINLSFSYSQPEIFNQDKPTIAILGSFHFAGSSDLIALKVDDLKSEKRQKEILDLVEALAKFKPTKVILEYPYGNNKLDSLYQQYIKAEHDLSINERQQIGFRLAHKMNHINIYYADHQMNLPFNELMTFLQENGRMQEFQKLLDFMKTEVLSSMQNTYDNSTLKEYFIWLNSDKQDKMNKNLYLKNVNIMGSANNYIGTDVVTKWWERNFRIMRNIDEIAEPNDRILILFGQGHTALLKDFYKDRDDIVFVDILNYLKN